MKKRFIIISLVMALFVASIAYAAITWQTTNEKTVGWNAVAVPSGVAGTISYNVYLANAVTDPNKTNPVVIGNTSDLTYTILLNTQGRYYAGVSTVLTIGTDKIESVINWSDDPEGNKDNIAFGIQYFVISSPGNFGPQ